MGKTKRVLQPNKYSCYAACAAMATGLPIEDVFQSIGRDGTEKNNKGFFRYEIAKFLAEKGYFFGVEINAKTLESCILRKQLNLTITFDWSCPCILFVESKASSMWHHAIFWDGTKLFDPLPSEPDDVDVEDYKIIGFAPIIRELESAEVE